MVNYSELFLSDTKNSVSGKFFSGRGPELKEPKETNGNTTNNNIMVNWIQFSTMHYNFSQVMFAHDQIFILNVVNIYVRRKAKSVFYLKCSFYLTK